MKIILDTNFLLIPGSLGIDVMSLIKDVEPTAEFFIVDKTKQELEGIVEKQSKKHRDSAKFALKLIEQKNIAVIKTKTFKNVDEIIKEKADKEGFGVATQDKGLRDLLINVPIFVLRQKKYILRVR